MRLTQPLTLLAVLAPTLLLAQSCPQSTQDLIQTCLDTVVVDEGKAPCSSSDWPCICNVQQGKIACYAPCPELEDYDDIRFNNENCNGQHGYTNQIAAGGNGGSPYNGSTLTTTVPPNGGSGGSTPTASATSASSTSAATATATSVPPSSSSSSAPSSSSSSAAASSSSATRPPSVTSSTTPNAASSSFDARLPLGLSVVSALLFGSGLALVGGLF